MKREAREQANFSEKLEKIQRDNQSFTEGIEIGERYRQEYFEE